MTVRKIAIDKISCGGVPENLGALGKLINTKSGCGCWKNVDPVKKRGWNMIALPHKNRPGFRLLLNQYNESLFFGFVDDNIPNRGVVIPGTTFKGDQFISALDYKQAIKQVAVTDDLVKKRGAPTKGDIKRIGKKGTPIHLEPGLLMHIRDQKTDCINLARLATIPHGNSVLALGRSKPICVSDSPEHIPDISGLPLVRQSQVPVDSPYSAPYKKFTEEGEGKFEGLFNPVHPAELLRDAIEIMGEIKKITELAFDTKINRGGILNTPFIEHQANAAEMEATFWIYETSKGRFLQYLQNVLLDFPQRGIKKGKIDTVVEPNMIRWPHVSINTLKLTDSMECSI